MNNCIFIVKLAEDPNQEYYQSEIKLLELKANFLYSNKIECTIQLYFLK